MEELTKAQQSRIAVRIFKTTADALALRGFYKPSGTSGEKLEEALRTLSPEIYGSMNDPRITELKGLEYVMERLPRGIEECSRVILTAYEELDDTSFERIEPSKRRRTSYRMSEREMCFVITRGLSEIYDILTHLTFLNIEARKIRRKMTDSSGEPTLEWKGLEQIVEEKRDLKGPSLDQAIWNLSKILGRTFHETKEAYLYFEEKRKADRSNNGLLPFVYRLGKRALAEEESRDHELMVVFTPSLRDMIGRHRCGEDWAENLKSRLCALGLVDRPVHVVSANLHSVANTLYGYAALKGDRRHPPSDDFEQLCETFRDRESEVLAYASQNGLHPLPDESASHIDCQIIDTSRLASVPLHPALSLNFAGVKEEKPVLLVMDYAFGAQAFEVMDELLKPFCKGDDAAATLDVRSISIMGKAGILCGNKGDIMLATAHVLEGVAHNYMVSNDLRPEDFDGSADVYEGPVVTVLGTSLQNRDLLQRFRQTSWRAVGLEMEGGHYQRAINAAIIRRHIRPDVKVRYAYYASDNPLVSGQTLAAGGMGREGIKPTYTITRVILEKIFHGGEAPEE